MSVTKIFLTVNVPPHSLETKDGELYLMKSLTNHFGDCLSNYLQNQDYSQEAGTIKHHQENQLVLEGCEDVKTTIENGHFPQVQKITIKKFA